MLMDSSKFYKQNLQPYKLKGFNEFGKIHFCIDLNHGKDFYDQSYTVEGVFYRYQIKFDIEEQLKNNNQNKRNNNDQIIDSFWNTKLTFFNQEPDLKNEEVKLSFNFVMNQFEEPEDLMEMVDKIY